MRKSRLLLLAGLMSLPIVSQASYLTPSQNLSILTHQVDQYHSSGAYDYDISQAANRALVYLKSRVAMNKQAKSPKKLAMVLDIDETSLSNYKDLKKLSFGGTAQMQNQAENRGDDPAIMPTLKLYQYAVNHGVTVFFITGRAESSRQATIDNLVKAGYEPVKESTMSCETQPVSSSCLLYLRQGKYLNTSAIPYKTAMRQKIEQAGYDIIINIGDQYSDLAGGYSDTTYKYPNYMYYIR